MKNSIKKTIVIVTAILLPAAAAVAIPKFIVRKQRNIGHRTA